MKLSQFVLALFIGSIILISCGKDNELTPNPIYDPEASGTTNNGGGNGGGSGGGGTVVNQGLKGNFGGTSVTINNCSFYTDTVVKSTQIIASTSDSSKVVAFLIAEAVTSPKNYPANDALVTIVYDLDATNDGTSTEYFATDGSLNITSVSSSEIKGTFNLDAINSGNFTPQSVTGGSFTAKKQ